MKKLIGILTCCLLAVSITYAQSGGDAPLSPPEEGDKPMPVMSFETTLVDYGAIIQNADPYREFHFTNTGDAPLVISNAKGSCGCTVPEWSKEPVMPGESSTLRVRYATNRLGSFRKTVTLTTNDAEGKHVLTIKGKVLQPDVPEDGKAAPTTKPEEKE